MSYILAAKQSCRESMLSSCKKNPVLEKALKKKITRILENPYHFKPLRHGLAGERRVHVLKNFVLRYEVDEREKTVVLLFFGHHDEAYER